MSSDSKIDIYGGKVVRLTEADEENPQTAVEKVLHLARGCIVGLLVAVLLVELIHLAPLYIPLVAAGIGKVLGNPIVSITLRYVVQFWILWVTPLLWFVQRQLLLPPTHLIVTD